MTCTVCHLDKNENEFQKYWHSTQNKFRTRKQCSSCFYLKRKKDKLIEVFNPTELIQPVVPELAPAILEEEYDTEVFRKCKSCGEIKLKEEHFTRYGKGEGYLWKCRKCNNEYEKIKYYEEMEAKGGSDKVASKPGVYHDRYQKEQTQKFLCLLGWKENSEGVYYKEGFKTEEGIWTKFNEKTLVNKKRVRRIEKGARKQKDRKFIPQEIIDGVLEMTKSGCKMVRIREKYNVSKYIVWRIREENQLALGI
jgi:hypothetical protein